MSAEIHGLPGINWSPEAALEAAKAVVQKDTPIMVLWFDQDGAVQMTSSNLKNDQAVYLNQWAIHMAMKGAV